MSNLCSDLNIWVVILKGKKNDESRPLEEFYSKAKLEQIDFRSNGSRYGSRHKH